MSDAAQFKGFPHVKDGDTFFIDGIEFIKFPDQNGTTPVLARNFVCESVFGDNNDFRSSEPLKKLQCKILPRIIAAIGEENLCTIRTDLTTLDGLKPYGVMESLISLPTLDFYRANVETIDKYPVPDWWWLATPESAKPHANPYWILCVSPSGRILNCNCNDGDGVRPFLILKSTIFESSEA